MNKFLSVLAIAAVSVACLSGAAPIEEPAPQFNPDQFRIYCRDVPMMMGAAAFMKDWHLKQAVAEPNKALMFTHLAEAKGLEVFLKELEQVRCIES